MFRLIITFAEHCINTGTLFSASENKLYMKRILLTLSVAILSTLSLFSGQGEKVNKETIRYGNELYLDRYFTTDRHFATDNKDAIADTLFSKGSPCVIFVFGGGFFTGARDKEMYLPYYQFLAKHGFQVIAIDYRLGLKPLAEKMAAEKAKQAEEKASTGIETKTGRKKSAEEKKSAGEEKMGPRQMIGMMENSINIAVEDLYAATAFVLEHANQWGINKELIITSGSSAGAITVLQAEYYMCNNRQRSTKGIDYTKYLPKEFRYAGVLSFAGAILNLHGKMDWETRPAPILLFHGNADSNVPYKRIWTPIGSFNGSAYIAKKLTKIEAPHSFYSIENATHSIATSPMQENLLEILQFLNTFVLQKKQWIINTEVNQLDAPNLKKNLHIRDYIKANFE